ncbi:MAG: hypothetical protein FWJ66_12130, partial [Caldibacillus sp.]
FHGDFPEQVPFFTRRRPFGFPEMAWHYPNRSGRRSEESDPVVPFRSKFLARVPAEKGRFLQNPSTYTNEFAEHPVSFSLMNSFFHHP